MGKWLDKDGLIDLKTRIKTKVDTKVDKYTEESAGKYLQTDSNGNAVWGTAASPSAVAEATEQWLEDNVSGGSTIAVDASLTVEGAAADAKATGALVKSAASQPSTSGTNVLWINESSSAEYQVPTQAEFDDLKSAININNISKIDLIQGFYYSNSTFALSTDSSYLKRVAIKHPVKCSKGTVVRFNIPSTRRIYLAVFSNYPGSVQTALESKEDWGDKIYTISNDGWLVVNIRKAPEDTFAPSDFDDFVALPIIVTSIQNQLTENTNNILLLSDYSKFNNISKSDLIQGFYNSNSTYASAADANYTKRVAIKSAVRCSKGTVVRYKLTGDRRLYLAVFSNYPGSSQTALETTSWLDGEGIYTINNDGWLIVNIRRAPEDTFAPSDYDCFIALPVIVTSIQNQLTENTNNISLLSDYSKFNNVSKSDLIQGAYNDNSTPISVDDSNYSKRICLGSPVLCSAGTVVRYSMVNDRYINIKVFSSFPGTPQTASQTLSWQSGSGTFKIEYDGWVVFNIRRSPENYISPSDYDCFIALPVIVSGIQKEIEILQNKFSKRFSYTGEKFLPVHSYIPSFFMQSTYSGSTYTQNDIDIYNGYMIAAMNPDEFWIYSMATKEKLYTVNANIEHGNTIAISKTFADNTDFMPIIYTGYSNVVNAVRIKSNMNGEVVKSYELPVSEYGYLTSTVYDFDANKAYTFGYGINSYQEEDNYIRFCVSDMSDLTYDSETEKYIMAKLSEKRLAWFGTMQGGKLIGDRIYIATANTGSPFNSKVFSLDKETGNIVSVVSNLPSDLENSELEGLCFDTSNGKSLMYVSEYKKIYVFDMNP